MFHKAAGVVWTVSLLRTTMSATCTTGTARCQKLLDAASQGQSVGDLVCDGCWDELGSTPLMHASYNNYVDVIKTILSAGEDVNHRAVDGATALMLAAKCRHCKTEEQLATLKLLLAANATVDLPNLKLETPLMGASKRGHVEAVELLLEHGARADLRDFRGVTALMLAASKGYGDVIKKLLQCELNASSFFTPDSDNCTLFSMDTAGLTAREWALGQQRFDVLDLLPQTPLDVWFLRMLRCTEFWGLVVLASIVAATSGLVHGCCYSESAVPVPSRSEEFLAIQTVWEDCPRHLAHVYRFVEVFSITVVPMQFMYEVHWKVVIPTYLALLIIPAYLRHGTLCPPCRMFASAPSLRLRTAEWTSKEVLWLVFGVLRVGFFFFLAWITHESDEEVDRFWEDLTHDAMREKGLVEPLPWRYAAASATNRASEEALDLLTHNPQSRECFFSHCAHTFAVGVLWTACTHGGLTLLMLWIALVVIIVLPCTRARECVGCKHDDEEIHHTCTKILNATDRDALSKVEACNGKFIVPIRVFSWRSPTLLILLCVSFDVFLDLNTVVTLLLHEDWRFATCILSSCLFTTMTEIGSGRFKKVLNNLSEMDKKGVWRDEFFDLLSCERNFESSIALLVLSYALPFAAKTPYQVICSAVSLLSSTLALSSEVHEHVDMKLNSKFDTL